MRVQTPQNYYQRNNTRRLLDKISKLFRKILPIYWAFLTYMLLRPGIEGIDLPFMFSGIDKILHLFIFAMLGFSFMAAFPRILFLYFFQIMLAYGLLTEILQDEMQLGRSLETLDLVADIFGVLLGYFFFHQLKNTRF